TAEAERHRRREPGHSGQVGVGLLHREVHRAPEPVVEVRERDAAVDDRRRERPLGLRVEVGDLGRCVAGERGERGERDREELHVWILGPVTGRAKAAEVGRLRFRGIARGEANIPPPPGSGGPGHARGGPYFFFSSFGLFASFAAGFVSGAKGGSPSASRTTVSFVLVETVILIGLPPCSSPPSFGFNDMSRSM